MFYDTTDEKEMHIPPKKNSLYLSFISLFIEKTLFLIYIFYLICYNPKSNIMICRSLPKDHR